MAKYALLVGVSGSPDFEVYPVSGRALPSAAAAAGALARPVHVVRGRHVRAAVDLVELDESGAPYRTVATIYEEKDEEDEEEDNALPSHAFLLQREDWAYSGQHAPQERQRQEERSDDHLPASPSLA